MTAFRWRGAAAAALLAAVLPALLRSQPRTVTRSFKTWGQYLGGADSSQYSALDQIDKRNVARLEVAWTEYLAVCVGAPTAGRGETAAPQSAGEYVVFALPAAATRRQ